MSTENPSPETPQTPTPPDPAPVTPQPGEKKRISTASTKLGADEPRERNDIGQYVAKEPAQSPVTPVQQPSPSLAPPPEVVAPAAATPKHPVWLAELAKSSGFTQEQIDRLDTNALGEGVRFAQARQQQAPPQPVQPAPLPEPPPEPVFDLGLSEEEKSAFDPEFIKLLNKVGLAAEKKAAALEQRLAQYEHREVQRTQFQVASAIDQAISGLGTEYHNLIGAGQGHEVMQTNPDAFRKRKFVLETLQQAGLNFMTASPAEIQARIKAQVDADWGMKPAQTVNPPIVTKKEWDRAGSPPPTHRTGKDNLPPREGSKVEERYQGALTEEEVEDERIMASLRRRKQPQTS